MSREKITPAERQEAVASLLELIKPGDTVYTILRHCAASGAFRVIDLVIPVVREGEYPSRLDQAKSWTCGRSRVYATIGDRPYERATLTGHNGQGLCAITFKDGVTQHHPTSGVQLVKITKTPAIRSIGWLAAKALDYRHDADRAGIAIGGGGMDMGFQLVYNLGRTLWPKGTKKPHGTRNGVPDRDGGYAIKQTWL